MTTRIDTKADWEAVGAEWSECRCGIRGPHAATPDGDHVVEGRVVATWCGADPVLCAGSRDTRAICEDCEEEDRAPVTA